MMIVLTYDVCTGTVEGQYRLRKVAEICKNYGQRVQNSVFECVIEPFQLVDLKNKLISIMDEEADSIRIYNLGSNWLHRVEHLGSKKPYNPEGTLIF